jgi:hypothetical protein
MFQDTVEKSHGHKYYTKCAVLLDLSDSIVPSKKQKKIKQK